jgi:hypothetical protein
MEFILSALYANTLVILYLDVWAIDLKLKNLLKIDYARNIKPLDCSLCLSFWFGLLIASPLGLLPAIKVGLLSIFVERIVNRIQL